MDTAESDLTLFEWMKATACGKTERRKAKRADNRNVPNNCWPLWHDVNHVWLKSAFQGWCQNIWSEAAIANTLCGSSISLNLMWLYSDSAFPGSSSIIEHGGVTEMSVIARKELHQNLEKLDTARRLQQSTGSRSRRGNGVRFLMLVFMINWRHRWILEQKSLETFDVVLFDWLQMISNNPRDWCIQ